MITRGIADKHRCLSTRLFFVAYVRSDNEFNSFFLESISKFEPIIPLHNQTKMHSGDLFPIDWIFAQLRHIWNDMGDDLMSKKFEYARFLFLSPGCTSEDFNIEFFGLFQIINGKRKMEWSELFRGRIICPTTATRIVFIPIALTNATGQNITST